MAEINDEKRTVVEAKVVTASSNVDYGKALTWFFKDKRFWSTTLKASLYLLSCILIVPIFYVIPVFIGYMIEVTANIQNGVYELPDDIGSEGQWKEGIVIALISFGFGLILSFIFSFGTPMTLPVSDIFSGTTSSSTPDYRDMVSAISGSAGGGVLSYVSQAISIFVNMLVIAIYAKTRDLSSLIKIDNYSAIFRKNGARVAVLIAILFVVARVVPVVGVMALCIGILPAAFVLYILNGSLYGQLDVSEVE